MATITSNFNFPTSKQVPDHSILDNYNKQVYLGNQFLLPISTTIAGTSETPLALFSNPTGNKLSIFANSKKLTCLTASQSAIFRFYYNPTVTAAGTPATPFNLRPASATTSSAVVTTSPTVSSNGTYVALLASSAFVPDISNVLTILDPGNTTLVTVQVSANSTAVAAEISWYEL